MVDYNKLPFYQLIRYIGWNYDVDKPIADAITLSNLFKNYWSFNSSSIRLEKFPLTINKLNKLLLEEFNKDILDISEWWKLKYFSSFMDDKIKYNLLTLWLDNKIKIPPAWVYSAIKSDDDVYVKVLVRLVEDYKNDKTKSRSKIYRISNIFNSVRINDLDEACELMLKSTPAVSVCILSRKDIADKYIVSGLKALSKLKNPRNINVKIDFESLKSLGPKGRLDTTKHLIGIMRRWRGSSKTKEDLPFKIVPTKEEMAAFLFPCSFKYNDEVSDLIKRYNDILEPIEVNKNVMLSTRKY